MSAPLRKLQLRKLQFLACVLVAVSVAWTDQAMAILSVDSFVAVRMIDGPNGLLSQTGGITNKGDLFGMERSTWPDDPNDDPDAHEHFEAPVRWLRSTGYQGEVVSGGNVHLQHPCCGGDGENVAVMGESFWGIHAGVIREANPHVTVGHSGFAQGVGSVDNWYGYHYDIENDVLTWLGSAMASGGNSQGLVVSTYSNCCGAHGGGYYSKVLDINAQGLDPEFEVHKWFPRFFPDDVFPWDINDNNVIVGNAGSLFGTARKPIKILPNEDGGWNGFDYVEMDTLLSGAGSEGGRLAATHNAVSISEGDRPFATGVSTLDDLTHAVVWDVNTGTIVADFGLRTTAHGISANGQYVIGSKINFFAFPPRTDPIVWMSDDDWQTWSELDINAEIFDAEEPPPGADVWESFELINGINDDGMIVGLGVPNPFMEGQNAGTAIFLLDTQELGSVLLGDVNNDGAIDNLDITPFITALASADEAAFLVDFPQGSYSAADVDTSGSPDNLDITPFISLLTGQGSASAVPEPASLALLAAGALMALRRGRRA